MSESTSNQEEYSGTTQSKEEATAKPDYEVVKSDASWINASQAAASKGGRLVSINNSDEFSKVCSFANSKGLKVFWVGLQRSAYDDWGDQTWNDGTSLSYAKWYPGEPSYYDEYGNDETYLMVWNVKGTWYYNDAVNDVSGYYKGKMGYIIEY